MTVLEKGLGKKAVHRSHLSKLQKQNDELLNIIPIAANLILMSDGVMKVAGSQPQIVAQHKQGQSRLYALSRRLFFLITLTFTVNSFALVRADTTSLSGDLGAALMIAHHAIAHDGVTADRQRALSQATTTYANDPITALMADRLQLAAQPNDLPILRATIAADLAAQEWPDALSRLAQLATIAPGEASARFQFAILLVRTDPMAAQAQLGALSGDPTIGALSAAAAQSLSSQPIALARRTIGVQLAGAGQWALASALLPSTLAAAPQDNVVRALLGTAQEAQGLDGWPLIEQALTDAPADPLVRYAAALHFQRVGNSYAALQFLLKAANDQALTATPAQQAGLNIAVASAYTQAGSLDLAAQYYQKAVNLVPRDPSLAEQFAAFYADQTYRPDLGLPFIRAEVVQFPTNAHLSASLGQILLNGNQPDLAVQAARRAVSLAPTDAYAELVLGRCLEYMGDQPGAQRAYLAAFQSTDPTGAGYRMLAAKALARPAYRPG